MGRVVPQVPRLSEQAPTLLVTLLIRGPNRSKLMEERSAVAHILVHHSGEAPQPELVIQLVHILSNQKPDGLGWPEPTADKTFVAHTLWSNYAS